MPFQRVVLSADGTPQYYDGEITLLVDVNTQLEGPPEIQKLTRGKSYLTTHRLIWVNHANKELALAINLRHIVEVEIAHRGGILNKKYFLRIFAQLGDGKFKPTLTLNNKRVCEEWLKKIQKAVIVSRRTAKNEALPLKDGGNDQPNNFLLRTNSNEGSSKSSSSAIGVAGRRQARENLIEAQNTLAESAFRSLQDLKLRATDIVAMIEQYANNPLHQQDDSSTFQFQSLLQTVGISNPILRETYVKGGKTGLAAFEQELSIELSKFLRTPLESAGGILLLTDVYCLYNRARGSSLVSPEELIEACNNWAQIPSIGKSMFLHTYPSGVKVIRQACHTDEMILERLDELLNNESNQQDVSTVSSSIPSPDMIKSCSCEIRLSAADVSRHLCVSLLIAREYLNTAELNGLFARDDTVEGLFFYKNIF